MEFCKCFTADAALHSGSVDEGRVTTSSRESASPSPSTTSQKPHKGRALVSFSWFSNKCVQK